MNRYSQTEFFDVLEKLIKDNGLTIDRPKDTAHPRYPDRIYPIDYGYINNTKSQDGQGIDVFKGTSTEISIVGIICTIDKVKNDSEIKVLYHCSQSEIETAMMMLTQDPMRAILIMRE